MQMTLNELLVDILEITGTGVLVVISIALIVLIFVAISNLIKEGL